MLSSEVTSISSHFVGLLTENTSCADQGATCPTAVTRSLRIPLPSVVQKAWPQEVRPFWEVLFSGRHDAAFPELLLTPGSWECPAGHQCALGPVCKCAVGGKGALGRGAVFWSFLPQMAREHLFCRKFTQLLLQTATEVACSSLIWFCLVELQGGLGPAPPWFCGVSRGEGLARP